MPVAQLQRRSKCSDWTVELDPVSAVVESSRSGVAIFGFAANRVVS